MIFDFILQVGQIGITRDEKRKIRRIEKNYFVMVDIEIRENPVQELAVTLDFLSEASFNNSDELIDQ
ncbi:MAG: hypothetical protein KAX49_11535 [Halanaerobiales bacterium]|nr:hypothetical protein [Halanaerobiales bacterium]